MIEIVDLFLPMKVCTRYNFNKALLFSPTLKTDPTKYQMMLKYNTDWKSLKSCFNKKQRIW
jgi:hypothetical protein